MALCRDTTELDIFSADSLKKLIQFKWENYGRKPHFYNFLMMVFYALSLVFYTFFVYIKPDPKISSIMGIVLVFSLLPTVSLNVQKLYKYGFFDYWRNSENVLDLVFNIIGVSNFVL